MRTIAVFNQKGGCGKTTTAIHLSACLAEAGKRTMLIDLDPQGHATIGTNVKQQDVECSTYDCLVDRDDGCAMLSLADIAWEILNDFYLAPASIMLSATEQRLADTDNRQERLLEALRRIEHLYDFTVIDCGPSMNLLSINALRAADTVIVPVETGFFAVESVGRVRETIQMVAQRTGHEPRVVILPTMYDPRTKSDRAAYKQLQRDYSDLLAETTIRFNAKLKEAAAAGSPITEYFPGCRGHKDYQSLAHELMAETVQFQMAEAAESERTVRQEQAAVIQQITEEILGPNLVDDGIVFVARAPGAQSVRLAGSFNGWNPDAGAMSRDSDNDSLWRLRVPLDRGHHEYRLVVDGRWTADPANPNTRVNEFGEFNSVVELGNVV
ncbi:MAG: AAA family ATPase [Planctomycetes bacterium]|nr:AAA family ATPase [Planctomycetota bacterium]